jgi:hypothetical protein
VAKYVTIKFERSNQIWEESSAKLTFGSSVKGSWFLSFVWSILQLQWDILIQYFFGISQDDQNCYWRKAYGIVATGNLYVISD